MNDPRCLLCRAKIAERRVTELEADLRALIPPAAAPAADYDPITAPIPAGDMNGPHGPIGRPPDLVGLPCGCVKDGFNQYIRRCLLHPPAAETGKAQGAEALLRECEEWMRGRLRHMGTGTVERISCETILAKLAARAAPPEREGKP